MADDQLDNLDFDNTSLDTGRRIPMIPSGSVISRRTVISMIFVLIFLVLGAILYFNLSSDSKSSKKTNQNNSTGTAIIPSESASESSPKKKKKIKYEKLYNQLESGDASEILKELSMAGIQFKTEQSGQKYSILVDETEIDAAQNLLAIKGLPSNTATGYALLDDTQTLGVTEFDKRIRFLRALSGELEKAISQIQIIESAKVQIVLPEQRLFTVTQPPVTASIIIRIQEGKKATDEIVFSIIQLVSNAVENLQPENISVVSTTGELLSDGIFERMAIKRSGLVEEKQESNDVVANREEALGYPIIPNYENIQQWFDIKWEFENKLKEKIFKQLLGILPIGSFKVDLTTDIGAIEEGSVIDVKRQTVSVVVDGLNENIFIDPAFKEQIFTTVAGTIGYVRGRDSIQLSVAEFPLYTESELEALKNKYRGLQILKIAAISCAVLLPILLLYNIVKRFRRRKNNQKASEIDLRQTTESFEPETEDITIKSKITELKDIASFESDLIAKVMSNWIDSDTNNELNNEDKF